MHRSQRTELLFAVYTTSLFKMPYLASFMHKVLPNSMPDWLSAGVTEASTIGITKLAKAQIERSP